jgi:unsaturated rhamnogalacturonyl hydrolase
MKRIIIIPLLALGWQINAQSPLSGQLAETIMHTWKDSFSLEGKPSKWTYDMGVVLKGIEGVWQNTGDGKYFRYIQQQMDRFVNEDGTIKTYKPAEFNIDHINNGRLLLLLYKVSGKEKYLKAARLLREQLRTQPRTSEGSFWHKLIYPSQVWLDGLYMAQPFYGEYAQFFHEDTAFDDIAKQFILIEKHTRDPKTGLLLHAWDESKQQQWANKSTGTSPLVWARAMGWYAAALVDVLDYFPVNHPRRKELISILNRLATALMKQQDKTTGLWYDVLNYSGPGKEKNYFEASASGQFVYAIAKGVRMGYLPATQLIVARNGYAGIIRRFIKKENDLTSLQGTVKVSGLGGNPYRDGSFAYYMSEPVIANDPKGLGACLMAANEMETLSTLGQGSKKAVIIDRYFNSEKKNDITGRPEYWHYVWEERSNPGFSTLGHVFNNHGAVLGSLDDRPSAANLKNASVYIIVDPDHIKDNPTPNYVDANDATVISNWVKAGGVLVLMTNDSANCDLHHINTLANRFGISFTDKSRNMVKNDEFETGSVIAGSQSIFKQGRKMYLKEISVLTVKPPAKALITKEGEVIMATVKYGNGTVFAVGDPWIYNEYLDGKKQLPSSFENYAAAGELVAWLLKQAKK